jgi:hypothetical protein
MRTHKNTATGTTTCFSACAVVRRPATATWSAIPDTIDLKNVCCIGFGDDGFLVNAVIAENDLAITQIAYHFDV